MADIQLKYRPDVDGLRAIAIVLVIAFHAFPAVMSGGFVGVDVFFVISGYLISNYIVGGLRRDSFSFLTFYARRIKRIVPALSTIMLAVLAFGWFVLVRNEFNQLCVHIAASASFVSNLVFWQEAGYFDTAAETKPLLHLWSLGVEEQFYLIWPATLWCFWKFRFDLRMGIITLIAVSFLANISLVHTHPAAAFYLPTTRLWEPAIGAMIGLLPPAHDRLSHALGRYCQLYSLRLSILQF
jgi:peptidoglycan/LPS O-acetylase OafA/YrhL